MSLAVGLLCVAAVALRIHVAWATAVPSPDGCQYLRMADRIAHGGALAASGSQFPDILRPPLHVLLLAAAIWVTGLPPFLAWKVLFVVYGLGVLFVLWRLTALVWDEESKKDDGAWEDPALWAAGLASVSPVLVFASARGGNDLLYMLLALVFLWLSLAREPTGPRSFGLGLLAGLCYLTRQIGMALALVWFCYFVLWGWRARKAARRPPGRLLTVPSLFVLGFLVLWGPHTYFVYRATGRLRINTAFTMARLMRGRLDAIERRCQALAAQGIPITPRVRRDICNNGLGESKEELYYDEQLNPGRRGKGIAAPTGPRRPLGERLSRISRAILRNLSDSIRHIGVAVNPVVVLGAGIGLALLAASRNGRRRRLLPIALFVLHAAWFPLVSDANIRFWFVPYAAGIIFAGRGLSSIVFSSRGVRPVAVLFLLVAVLCPWVRQDKQFMEAQRTRTSQVRKVLDAWSDLKLEGKRLMSPRPELCFLAGAEPLVLPFAPLEDVEIYARHQKADFIHVDRDTVDISRPHLRILWDETVPPWLERICCDPEFVLLRVVPPPASGTDK